MVVDTTALKMGIGFLKNVSHPGAEPGAVYDAVIAGAGLKLSALCKAALDSSLTGLEFAYGIPGTVGGDVYKRQPVILTAAAASIAVFVTPSLYEVATVLRLVVLLAAGLAGPVGLAACALGVLFGLCLLYTSLQPDPGQRLFHHRRSDQRSGPRSRG